MYVYVYIMYVFVSMYACVYYVLSADVCTYVYKYVNIRCVYSRLHIFIIYVFIYAYIMHVFMCVWAR